MMKNQILLMLAFICLPISAQLTVPQNFLPDSLCQESILLNEVVIKARKKNIVSRGLGNMQINVKQLQLSPLFLGERDIIKTLQFLPGVSAGMEGSSQLNIRGGTSDQTLYLIDNAPIYNQNHTFGLFSTFNADAISSVDLYKGGIPTLYGDKLSGVVAVDLKDGDFNKFHHSISLGLLAGSISSQGPVVKDKLSYLITGRRSFIDLLYKGFMRCVGNDQENNPMVSFYDLNGKLTWKINAKNDLSWQIYSGYDNLSQANKSISRSTSDSYTEKHGYGWQTLMSALRFRSQLSSSLSLSFNAYHTTLKNFSHYQNAQKTMEIKQKTEIGHDALLSEFGGQLSMIHHTDDRNTLYYGVEGVSQSYTPECVYKKVNNEKTIYQSNALPLKKLSAYLYDEFRFKQWFLSVGLRAALYHNSTSYKSIIEPRIKVNTYINDKNKLMIAYDKMSQPTHTLNEMNYTAKSDFWIPFQEKSLPQCDQVSIGWKNSIHSNLTLSVEMYYKRMKNLLLIKNLEYYLDSHTDYELGTGCSRGVEFMAEYSKNRLTGWLSYTLSKSQRTFSGRTYPYKYDAPHDISAFGSYIVSKTPKRMHTVSLQVQYKSGYPYYLSETTYPGMGLPTLPSGYEEVKNSSEIDFIPQYSNVSLKDYFRIDANYTIEKTLRKGQLIWQFSLLNVTNQKNPYTIYRKDGGYKAFVLIPFFPSISIRRTF